MVDVRTVEELVAPIVEANGCRIYDVTYGGRTLKIVIDRDGGVGMNDLHTLTRQLSVLFDEHDPISGSYTLEITSPGLERKLTRVEHFAGAVGSEVSVKVRDDDGVTQRWQGRLTAADDDGVVLGIDDGERRIPYGEITGARTVFDWGPAPKPGQAKSGRTKKNKQRRADQEQR